MKNLQVGEHIDAIDRNIRIPKIARLKSNPLNLYTICPRRRVILEKHSEKTCFDLLTQPHGSSVCVRTEHVLA